MSNKNKKSVVILAAVMAALMLAGTVFMVLGILLG